MNALYDFYDHQFASADAGSPSKVEQTVGSGLLPSHIEHTVPDVASFFKRVLIDLPGGLLGSVELFEAVCNITMNFGHDNDLSEPELATVKAKMIALAISSVPSDYRLYLIQAVLGLVSYLGHEAEKFQAETASVDEDQGPSELMNYKSLGVVLGPLLLGNLTDRAVHGGGEGHSADPRTSLETDSAKKSRKHKRKHSDIKLDQSATLAAFVDRANRTASVMQQLLLMWPGVVKQLRDINGTASSSLNSGSRRHLKKVVSQTGSRLTLKTSEEEMRFLDILRGRTLPEEFRGAVRMKSNIRMTSRSPMSRGAIGPSGDEHLDDIWAPAASEEHFSTSPGHTKIAEHATRENELAVNSKLRSEEDTKSLLADDVGLGGEDRTPSDIAMDKMAMGTILPPLPIRPSTSSRKESCRLINPLIQTPGMKQSSSSSSETPRTALRDAPRMEHSHESEESQLHISMRKPLPPITDVQRAELSNLIPKETVLDPPSKPVTRVERPAAPRRNVSSTMSSGNSFSSGEARRSAQRTVSPSRQSGQLPSSPTKQRDEEAMFPPRQSSLPMEKHLALKPIETYTTLAEYKAKADTYMSPPKFNISRKAGEGRTEQSEVPLKPNNVKALAQRFTEASRAMRKNTEGEKETAIPRIYAFVNSLPPPKSPMLGIEDPFVSAESSNVSKESLIPKPVRDVGRSRESRSLSPPKRAAPKVNDLKRRSAFGIVTDRDAEIVERNTTSNALAGHNAGEEEIYDELNVDSNEVDDSKRQSTQLLPTSHHKRSAEYLLRRPSTQELLPETQRLHNRSISFAELARPVTPSHPDSLSVNVFAQSRNHSRSNSYLIASDALKPLERHGSINATMYRDICDLRHRIQQMGEEKEAKDRRIQALEEVLGGNPVAIGLKGNGSFGKGGLHNEVRKAKREVSLWKMRAELAEGRLSELKQLPNSLWENETAHPWDTDPTERSEFDKQQDDEKDLGSAHNVPEDSADLWRGRGIVAESRLTRNRKQEGLNMAFDVQEEQRDIPDLWKGRATIAESLSAQMAPLNRTGPYNEMVGTAPSATTAKVRVAVETESGEKEVGSWDWRGGEGGIFKNGDYSQTNETNEADRRAGSMKRSRGSDDESSDFASALNGFG